MSLVFGYANPVLQKVLLELCFSEEAIDPLFRKPRLSILDQALKDDVLSGEQLRVLPLLYRSTSLDGMSTESVSKVVGMYKYTFCRNNLMLHRLGQVQTLFTQAGFAPMIGLKGLPAIAYVQLGIGARPMADVDVLIPHFHERPEQAFTILDESGFKLKGSGFRSVTMTSQDKLEFDLHWYVHDWALGQDLVDRIIEYAKPQSLGSQLLRIPCVEHHLAHTIAHGVLTNTLIYDARWVFDTVAVIKRAENIDIDRFVEFANRVMAPQRIRDALSALATELPDTIAIDRAKLWRLYDAVSTNPKLVSWLYEQAPEPNLPAEQRPRSPRLNPIKAMLVGYFWVPRYLRKRQGLSFLDYFRWLEAFPPRTHRNALWHFTKKIFLRGPVFLYRVLAPKISTK
ncbi:Uncharacterised nucleotidyltransferase [Burkholderiaceae bacterium]